MEGLEAALRAHIGEAELAQILESEFDEEPRRFEEIMDAEQEFFDRA